MRLFFSFDCDVTSGDWTLLLLLINPLEEFGWGGGVPMLRWLMLGLRGPVLKVLGLINLLPIVGVRFDLDLCMAICCVFC